MTSPAFQNQTAATAPAVEEQKPTGRPIPEDTPVGFGSAASFALLQRGAMLLANSTLVPKEFQNNLPNCVIALNMAERMGADPLMVMQNLYVVGGRPSWSSQFLIATFNQNGRYTALRYEFKGTPGADDWGCRAWCVEKATEQKLCGAWVTFDIVKREGWYDRKDKDGKYCSKWRTMPEQMFMYRAAAWFIRAYAPEIAMGLRTVEEQIDVGPMMDEIIEQTAERLRQERDAVAAAVDAAPTKLDALVEADRAREGAQDLPRGESAAAAEKKAAADGAMAQAKEKIRQKAESAKPKAAPQPENPNYATEDPFVPGESLFS